MKRMTEIDRRTPRRAYLRPVGGGTPACPGCGRLLQQRGQTYMFSDGEDTCLGQNESGWFCSHCPTVVIDPEFYQRFFSQVGSHGGRFTVLGMVDWDAVPEDQQDRILADEDADIPLIEFTDVIAFDPLSGSRVTRRGQDKGRKARRKKERKARQAARRRKRRRK